MVYHIKDFGAVPFLPSALLRKIVKQRGIHLYSLNPLVYTYINAGALCVYNATQEDAVVDVGEDGIYIDRLTNTVFLAEKGQLHLPLRNLRAYLLTRQSH